MWILANCFTKVDIKILPAIEGTYSNLHIHNIIGVLFLAHLLLRCSIKVPKNYIYILLMFAETSIVWMINLRSYGISSGYMSVLYGMIIMFYIASVKDLLNYSIICEVFEKVALIMSTLITCNIVLNIQTIIKSISSGLNHPDIDVFFSGGVNGEATLMTMFGVFFRKKWRYRYWAFTMILSVIYLSRAAIMVNILQLLIYLYNDGKGKILKNIIICSLLIVIVMIFAYQTGLISNIVDRFANMNGNEGGSKSRLIIWGYVLKGLRDRPFGIGFGNTMKFLESSYGLVRAESNPHNIYIQCLLENNIVGFVLMMVGWLKLVIDGIRCRFSNPFGVYLIVYAFQGLIQMQLKEPFLFLNLALYLCVPVNGYENMKSKLRLVC